MQLETQPDVQRPLALALRPALLDKGTPSLDQNTPACAAIQQPRAMLVRPSTTSQPTGN